MGLVVDGSMDLGTHIWHPPQVDASQRERAWDPKNLRENLYMDNCNKWQKQKLQKLAKCMYGICFDSTRRYFGVFLSFTQKK